MGEYCNGVVRKLQSAAVYWVEYQKMALPLPAKMAALLSEVLRKRPGMIDIVASPENVELTDDQRDELRQAVTDELIETGLRDDDEPNERGLLLDELIDCLGHL